MDAEEQMNDEGSTGVSSSVVPRVSLCLGLRGAHTALAATMHSTLTPDGLRLPQGLSCEPSLPLRAAGASETIEDVILASRPTASEETPWYRPQPSGCSGCAADGRAYSVCVSSPEASVCSNAQMTGLPASID